ncbi:MAG: Uma2 family endonuclease [Gemmatimonadota bacterium]
MTRDPLASQGTLLTIEEFHRLPDDGWRCELVRGEVVREPPAGYEHGRLANRILHLLTSFVEERGLGEVLASETGFVLFEEPPTVRAPDAAFVAGGRIPSPAPPGYGRLAPDLAVEVVSPSNTVADIHAKVMDYLDAGSRLVWVMDPSTRSVTAYRSRKRIRLLTEGDELDGEDVLPGFRMPLAEVFRPKG